MNNYTIPRSEHPRPDFQRDTFLNLNGPWQFAFDDQDEGLKLHWYTPGHAFDQAILVPFAYQTKLSGIGPTDEIHPMLWYRRSFEIPQEMAGKRIFLCFGAVDFEAMVYVNRRENRSHHPGF